MKTFVGHHLFTKYIPSEEIKRKRRLEEIVECYFSTQTIKSRYSKRGKRIEGEWIKYFQNGQVNTKGNTYTGEEVSFYNNSTNSIRCQRCRNEDGERIGEEKTFFENGTIATESYFENGCREKRIEYNTNGTKRVQIFMIQGVVCTESEYEAYSADRLASRFVW